MNMTARAIKLYDGIAEEYAKRIEAIPSIKQFNLFKKYVTRGRNILDAGCAAGRDCQMLSTKGYSVTGIDLLENLLTIAKREYPALRFVHGDIRTLPFENNSFDAIWANAILHHLIKKDMKRALREFFRVLKPNGIVFVTTKLGKGTWKVKEAFSSGKEREFTLLTARELTDMLKEADFKERELSETKSDYRELYWIRAIYEKS
jgi:ubiquinone/menaquinone biosynthesis C-methylase UbiE